KAAGEPIVDVTMNCLRAYIESFSRANLALATSATRFHIPLYVLDGKGRDRMLSAAPMGRQLQLELVYSDTSLTTPTTTVGWGLTSDIPTFSPRIIQQAMNIGASITKGRFNFSADGSLRGLAFVTANVSRFKAVVSNREEFDLVAAQFAAAQDMERARTITTDYWHKIEDPIPAAVGASYAELDTAASHAATNALTYYALVAEARQ
ncbi:MAG: hypothetical protein AAB368_14275, partial [bacterium]